MACKRLRMGVLAVAVCAVTALSATVSAQDEKRAKYDSSWRQPEIAIPLVERAPALDGKVDALEWSKATLFPPFVSRNPLAHDGLPPRQRQWAWMCYTTDAVYVAWRQDLPPEELPVAALIAQRDRFSAKENDFSILFSRTGGTEEFNFDGNALGRLRDRTLHDGKGYYWNPDVEYKARKVPTGWEAELKIPFKELGVEGAPEDDTKWGWYFYSQWRKTAVRVFTWPYVNWRKMRWGHTAWIIFAGRTPPVRFERDGVVTVPGGKARVETTLLYRPRDRESLYFWPSVETAINVSAGEAATFSSLDKIFDDNLAPFREVARIAEPGEYLMRYDITLQGKVLARGLQAYAKYAPAAVDLKGYWLKVKKLEVVATTILDEARTARMTVTPGDMVKEAPVSAGRAEVLFDTAGMEIGEYELRLEVLDEPGNVLHTVTEPFRKPPPPDWWTMKEGYEPLIPPPYRPIKVTKEWASVLLREYRFVDMALPTQVKTVGREILAGPILLITRNAWVDKGLKLIDTRPERAVYESRHMADGVQLRVRTQVEFDGFMYVDLFLTGDGMFDKLDLVIPFRREHAILQTGYTKAPGPGKYAGRPWGLDSSKPIKLCPMLTLWVGTDRYGLEFSCESSRGWAMRKPSEAVTLVPEGERRVVTMHMIDKPIRLSREEPRHIRFGLIATPAKTVLPYVQDQNPYETFNPALLPGDWSGISNWHAPVKDAKVVEKVKKWVDLNRRRGMKLLVNGGWAISVQDPTSKPFVHEMFADPLMNVSHGTCRQYAYTYNSPYPDFLANSFAYNARKLGFDGIRFDTVVPGYVSKKRVNGDGWYDDDGNLWGTQNIFHAREFMKRLYRTFHGGVVKEGLLYVPNAGGPIMAVHAFADMQGVGEGFYQKAKNLKLAYPPRIVRTAMSGRPFGHRLLNNLKMGPLFWSERIAAMLVNGAELRARDERSWKPGYEAHARPMVSIWEAKRWIDYFHARFYGHWENASYLKIDTNGREVYGSFHHNPERNRALLVVSNYEKEPIDALLVTLDVEKLGLRKPLFAEDAITYEPVPLSADGRMGLDVFGQRYRLIMISSEPPRFRDEVLGPNLVADVKAADPQRLMRARKNGLWMSQEFPLEPKSTYVATANIRIDQKIGGARNYMGRFSPVVRSYFSMNVHGKGVFGICGANKRTRTYDKKLGLVPYKKSELYRRKCPPQIFEKTPGWTTVFLPLATGPATTTGKLVLACAEPAKLEVRKVSLRKRLAERKQKPLNVKE